MKKMLAFIALSVSTISFGSTYQVTLNLGKQDTLLNNELLKEQESFERQLQKKNVLKKSYEVEKAEVTKRTFYIKANSELEAKRMLAASPVNQYEDSGYKIRNVGNPILSSPKTNMSSKTYRVSLEWLEGNKAKVQSLYGQQIKALVDYHKKGIIEDAYMKNRAQFNESEKLPRLSFTIKASSKEEAKRLVKELPFAKNQIAKFKVRAIGGPTHLAFNG